MKIWKTSENIEDGVSNVIVSNVIVDNIISSELVICPFCKEKDFDFVGLKSHLVNGDCEIYNKVSVIQHRF